MYKSKTALNAAGGMGKNKIYFKSHKTKGTKETEKIKNKLKNRYWQNHRQIKKKNLKNIEKLRLSRKLCLYQFFKFVI